MLAFSINRFKSYVQYHVHGVTMNVGVAHYDIQAMLTYLTGCYLIFTTNMHEDEKKCLSQKINKKQDLCLVKSYSLRMMV